MSAVVAIEQLDEDGYFNGSVATNLTTEADYRQIARSSTSTGNELTS
jgi:hypothetical protein